MNINIWSQDDFCDLGAVIPEYNYLLFKANPGKLIVEKSIKIGNFNFIPGCEYSEIGVNKKTSSGFSFYKGEPLMFLGTYNNFLLFVLKNHPFIDGNGYFRICFCYRILSGFPCLFTLNQCGAGRIIEME